MDTTQRIKTINDLNDIGMRLARTPTMQDALRLHEVAANLAEDPSLPQDYLQISNANCGYALRQLGDYEGARQLLLDVLRKTDLIDRLPRTYSGRGRLHEELGLIVADGPTLPDSAHRISAVKHGLSFFERAIEDYNSALTNSEPEVYTPAQLTQRKLRTIGMRAPKARNLGELTQGEERQHWFNTAVGYAQEEVTAREALGETSGQNLATAYHTLGQALTELAVDDFDRYQEAKDAFDKAAKVPGVQENTLVTLHLRRAWLGYKYNPSEDYSDAIAVFHFELFLAGADKLTNADKNALRRRVVELGNHLGGSYQERAELF